MTNFFLKAILMLVFLGIVPLSCHNKCRTKNSCGCQDLPVAKDYSIKSLSLKTVNVNSRDYADSSLYYDNDSIAKLIYIKDKLYTLNSGELRQTDFSFSSSAFACSPIEPKAIQKISAIAIIARSTTTINASHTIAIGDTLNNLFRVNTSYIPGFITIPDFIQSNLYYTTPEEFWFKFNESPTTPITLKFDIKIQLTDNSVHEFPSQELKVK